MTSPRPSDFLYDAPLAKALDAYAVNTLAIDELSLMQRAGNAAAQLILDRWPQARSISIICGSGNNAGDGYVVADTLNQQGLQVQVAQIGDTTHLGESAKVCQKKMSANGIAITKDLAHCNDADVIVDALFGLGLSRPLETRDAAVIDAINKCRKPVLSLDLPSGLDASTGRCWGPTINATITITFICAKQGLFTGAGPDRTGELVLEDLALPESIFASNPPSAKKLFFEQVKDRLKPRARSQHKGHHGHTLLIGGAPGYIGALLLAGEAAARAGAGLISLVSMAQSMLAPNFERPELMLHSAVDDAQLDQLIEKSNVIAIGPGLGNGRSAMRCFSRVLACNKPLVVDADALRMLGNEAAYRDNWVLTPHPGEAAHLLACSTSDIQHDRFAAASAIHNQYGGVVVLKGVGSIVQGSDKPEIVMHGNPGMGSGGMGDVLTGVISGLLAQGLGLNDAARLGTSLHARAGDIAAESGERGLLARDLMPHIRQLANS